MATGHHLYGLRLAILGLALLTIPASCAGHGLSLEPGAPAVSLSTPAASGWQADELAVTLRRAEGGWSMRISSAAVRPARVLLLEAHFPPEFSAAQAQALTPAADLSLLVTDRPGVLAFGVLLPQGRVIAPGTLLQAKLVPTAGPLRAVSKAPAGTSGHVPDLAGTEDGVGRWAITWGYYNTGDLNQDNQVSIADLTPLGVHFGEQSPAPPGPFPPDSIGAVVDTNGDGLINVGDLAPLGINYLNRVQGYHVYRADGPDPQAAVSVQVAEAAFATSELVAGSRRRFNAVLPSAALIDGAYYYLKPYDGSDGSEGAASNVVQYTRTQHLKFYLPGGNTIADNAQCQDPSLVLMPAIPGVSEPGAPVIVYTTLGGGGVSPLMLSYFGEAGWVNEEIGGGGNFSMPQAFWIPGAGGSPGEGVVIANAIGGAGLTERRYDGQWQFSQSHEIGAGTGVFSRLACDREASTGRVGVAHAYTSGGGSIVYSSSDGSGAWDTQAVYDGESIAGLAFRFDPAGGDPWLVFTHGTSTVSTGLITLDYSMEQARLHGGTWNTTPIPYPDSPQLVDLAFRADGTPQLVCTAAREFKVPLLNWTVSLLYDVATFEYNGSGWSFQTAFESAMNVSLQPPKLELALDLASDASWAKPDELVFTQSTGSISFDITTYIPDDGGLANGVQYLTRQTGAFYSPSGYYTGDPGRAYSWAVNAQVEPVCAYVRSATITALDVLNGNFAAAGELAFWQP